MAKKEKVKKKKEDKPEEEKEEQTEDRGGFPADIDFRKNLGCGG